MWNPFVCRLSKAPTSDGFPLAPIQRSTYRQLLYWVTLGALWMAVKRQFVGWSKLLRTGSVKAPAE